MDLRALEAALALLPSFGELRVDERLRAAEKFRVVELPVGGEHRIQADAPELVVVVHGRADLLVERGAPLALFAGDVFGEQEIAVGRGSEEQLRALEPTSLAVLDRAGLDALFEEFPALAPPWVAELARELKWRNDLLREVSLAHAENLPPKALEAVLKRRRANLQRRRASPVRRATARLVRALFTAPGTRPSFWVLVGVVSALAVARTVVAMIIKNGLQKHLFALIGSAAGHPIHVHHFNYGLLLVAITGVAVLVPRTRSALRRLAFVFGFGLGLIVDEFALLWNLNPDYYQASSRVVAGLVLLLIAQVVWFRALYLSLFHRLLERLRP
jgi:CRP-like cAMP-binding protein